MFVFWMLIGRFFERFRRSALTTDTLPVAAKHGTGALDLETTGMYTDATATLKRSTTDNTFAGICHTTAFVAKLPFCTLHSCTNIGLANTILTMLTSGTAFAVTGFVTTSLTTEFPLSTGDAFAGIADVVFVHKSVTIVVFSVADFRGGSFGENAALQPATVKLATQCASVGAFAFSNLAGSSFAQKQFVDQTIAVVVFSIADLSAGRVSSG